MIDPWREEAKIKVFMETFTKEGAYFTKWKFLGKRCRRSTSFLHLKHRENKADSTLWK